MSAIIGGIDVLTVIPFDATYMENNDFSDRLAKNQQLVLKEEAYLDKVIDPAEGSYYIETITESIINESWKLFLDIENKGGFIKSFEQNIIQNQIKIVASKRDNDIDFGKRPIIGTNKYPMHGEDIDPNSTRIIFPRKQFHSEGKKIEPLWNYRGSSRFEFLRGIIDDEKVKIKVFLLLYGNPVMRKARANFASDFFSCAGFEIIDSHEVESIDEGIKAALNRKADITVICSSDEEYAKIVPAASIGLKDKTELVVAGYPKEHISMFKDLGITDYIHLKSNIFETLKNFQSKLTEE
jgi:methylmalonyl-CoA mutase